jgi:hypothetical protein
MFFFPKSLSTINGSATSRSVTFNCVCERTKKKRRNNGTRFTLLIAIMSVSNPGKGNRKFCHICGSIFENENKNVSIFTIPKKKLSSWQLIIPQLKQTSVLCERQNVPSDIVKKDLQMGWYFMNIKDGD